MYARREGRGGDAITCYRYISTFLRELIAVRYEGRFSRTSCGVVLTRCVCLLIGFRRVSEVIRVGLIEEGSGARAPLVMIFQDLSTLQYVLNPFTSANIGQLYCTTVTTRLLFQKCGSISKGTGCCLPRDGTHLCCILVLVERFFKGVIRSVLQLKVRTNLYLLSG